MYEIEDENGIKAMYEFGLFGKMEFKNGFKIAPGTKITDDLQDEIAPNWDSTTIELMRVFEIKDKETGESKILLEPFFGKEAADILSDLTKDMEQNEAEKTTK
jgi:hypothetical protein